MVSIPNPEKAVLLHLDAMLELNVHILARSARF
jgi:hypothetical protein